MPRLIDSSIVPRLTGSTCGRSGPLLKSKALDRMPDAEPGSFAKQGTVTSTHIMMVGSTRNMEVVVLAGMELRVVCAVGSAVEQGALSARLSVFRRSTACFTELTRAFE